MVYIVYKLLFFHWRIYLEKKIPVGSMIYQPKSPPPNKHKTIRQENQSLGEFLA